MQAEIPGPIAVLMPVIAPDEVIRLSNDSIFGLAASVWAEDRRDHWADVIDGVLRVEDRHRLSVTCCAYASALDGDHVSAFVGSLM